MKIAIFTDTFMPQTNGVVSVVKTHARELKKRGHDVIIFTAQPKRSQKKKVLEEFGKEKIKVHFIPAFELPTYKEYRVATPTWVKSYVIIKKFSPDIIHSHTNFGVGWEAINCAKLLGVPLFGHHHTFWTDYLHHLKIDREFMKKVAHYYIASYFNRCNLIISPSQSLKDELLENKVTKPVHVLANSIDLNAFKTDKKKADLKRQLGLQSNKVVMYFGRVSKEKSIDVLLKAFKEVVKQLDDARLLIIGDGPAMKDLKALAKKLKIQDKTIFTGMLTGKELHEAVAAADIFASASASENQPMTFLEAMSFGLPMVGTNAKGAPELIHDKKNGLLFPPKNHRKMAECIIKILRESKRQEEMGASSARYAKDYSNEKIIEELLRDYQMLIREKNAKKPAKSLS